MPSSGVSATSTTVWGATSKGVEGGIERGPLRLERRREVVGQRPNAVAVGGLSGADCWCVFGHGNDDCRRACGLDALGCHVSSRWVIPGYTQDMKTAISVPDETFEKASRRAHDLGMSRSEFFSRAAARYLDELDAESVTRQIDQAVAAVEGRDDSGADAVVVGQRVLADASGDW